ncbi:MAG: hypothetical protein J7K65_07325 [Planctomycetes bacterium]|nr:hypothetical protein [Planctomycetota bacterium]
MESASYVIDKPYYKGPLRVKVRVSDKQAMLSDLLTLELSAETKSNYEVQFPAVAETLKQFRIRSWSDQPETLSENGTIIKTNQYRLEPLELGQCEIPPLTFNFKQKGTSGPPPETGTLTTESVWIEVTTSLPTDPNAFGIADIDDVVEIKTRCTWLWICLPIACLLALGIGIGLRIKSKKTIGNRRLYKSAHEIAFETLKAMAQENLVEQGRVREFYEKLSTCLRQYIENRFRLRAPEQTTEEFLDQLRTSDALKLEHKQQLQEFLKHCDLVKFARYRPSNEQINKSLTMAEKFIEKTKSEEHLVDVTEAQSVKEEGGL